MSELVVRDTVVVDAETGEAVGEPTGKSLVLTPQGPITRSEFDTLARVAKTVANTHFVPRDLRGNAAAVMACVMYGREQGLGPMVALKEIHVIDGRPAASAALLSAQIRARGHELWEDEVLDDAGNVIAVTVYGRRRGATKVVKATFSLAMAERAGLRNDPKKPSWTKYPEDMMWARAVSRLARRHFSDVFLGAAYVPEELGADVAEAQAVADPEPGQPAAEDSEPEPGPTPASPDQHARLNARCGELDKSGPPPPEPHANWTDYSRALAREMFGVESRADLTFAQMHELIDRVDTDAIPF